MLLVGKRGDLLPGKILLSGRKVPTEAAFAVIASQARLAVSVDDHGLRRALRPISFFNSGDTILNAVFFLAIPGTQYLIPTSWLGTWFLRLESASCKRLKL